MTARDQNRGDGSGLPAHGGGPGSHPDPIFAHELASWAQVREAVCILDLDVEFRPCPKEGTLWRPE